MVNHSICSPYLVIYDRLDMKRLIGLAITFLQVLELFDLSLRIYVSYIRIISDLGKKTNSQKEPLKSSKILMDFTAFERVFSRNAVFVWICLD